MTKIVYNACHGGFGLSEAAIRRYAGIKGLTLYPEASSVMSGLGKEYSTWWTIPPEQRVGKTLADDAWHAASDEERQASNKFYRDHELDARSIARTDPVLVQVVEELGDAASGQFAKLRVAEVAAGQRYRIDEYDGRESVMTIDDYDWSVA